jgi:hypothetical protein
MEFKTATVVACWISIAVIASVYMIVFAGSIGDVLFGVFLPVGALVFVAVLLTVYVASVSKPQQTE